MSDESIASIKTPPQRQKILDHSTFATSMTQQNIITSTNLNNKNSDKQGGFAIPALPSEASNGPKAVQLSPALRVKNGLPAFLNKLYCMVNSSETDPWVHWNDDGDSFIVPNSQTLAEQVLGRHFKHNNFASFVRQLNMYGFHKVPHLNHGVLHNDGLPEVWEFNNENFHRDHPWRMRYIIRKKGEAEKAKAAVKLQQRQEQQGKPSSPVSSPQPHLSDPEDVAIARAEIQTVAMRQGLIRDEVVRLAESTENLWKYALETRQRYQEQQDRLDKLVKFLSEALRTRASNPEFPNRVRGLLEGPTFEELPDKSPTPTPTTMEQGQLEVMKMIANGKVPMGLQEAIQQYLVNAGQTNIAPQTPLTSTSPASFEPQDSMAMYQAANNAQQLAQVQEWADHTDQSLNGLGADLHATANANYGDYLSDSHFAFDSFIPPPDPAVDTFTSDSLLDTSLHTWLSQYVHPDQEKDTNTVGQKRTLEDEKNDLAAKRARI
jgi:hypothetical protein